MFKIPEKPEGISDRFWALEVRSIRRRRKIVAMSIASILFSLGSIAITLMRMLR